MGSKLGYADEFEKLIVPFERKIYFSCLHLMGNEADAQDCAQEAILHAYRAYGRFRCDAEFSSWIFRITNNVCIDALRKRRREVSLDEIRQTGFDPPSDEPSAYELLVENERKDLIRKALGRIPEDMRIILVLRDLQGLSYTEVASLLKIPAGTVKSRINRARKKLSEIISADLEHFAAGNV